MKHFISLTDVTTEELHELLDIAVTLKAEWKTGGNKPILQGKTLALIFQKPSLRTRVSFEMGMVHLGGHALNLLPQEVKMGGRETVSDVVKVLSGYVDGIMARVFVHNHLEQLAEHGSIPIINGLSDYNHPVQALTDLLTILEHRGTFTGQTITYVGDGNNVSRSLMIACMMVGLNFRMATPAGYSLAEEDVELAYSRRLSDKQRLDLYEDPIKAVAHTDIVYTDVWTSMGQEEEATKRLEVFPPYQLNKALLSHAKADHTVMHCLPAHRGQEITDVIADGLNSVIFPQAHNRLHAQKAILAKLLA